ncbi:major capsid protein VP1 [Microviridae Bog5275_51]|uniref:major capsid protein VP1 n=1 Tax=Microviridae Bog5275_51 TaxID=1655648 RepID=UPI00063D6127|nr:major capsid protein VP1 [Microviridae Bog5275_51]AKI26877.1 major capsid protein VP1 [Microviridae Bog5275_51]
MSKQRIINTGQLNLTERPTPNYPHNSFNLSHSVKLSFNYGNLVPVMVMDVVPGDRVHIDHECLLRYQPMIAPPMQRVKVRSESFFVPYRLLWPNFESAMGQRDVSDPAPAFPTISVDPEVGISKSSLANYLGMPVLPVQPGGSTYVYPTMNAFRFAAYQKIFADWYADEDLQIDSVFVPLSDGDNGSIETSGYGFLNQRLYDLDYFTVAKPWPQKGSEVVIPALNTQVPVSVIDSTAQQRLYQTVNGTYADAGAPNIEHDSMPIQAAFQDGGGFLINLDPKGSLGINPADWAGAAGTIEQLRVAEAMQRFLEADSRGGTRYGELIYAHFGVMNPDARLQYSEYLGSTSQQISFGEVLNTTGTSTAPQGAMAGHGVSAHKTNAPYHCNVTEHGVILTLMSVLPDTGYYQGVPKEFFKNDRLDYLWPEYAMLGEQPINKGEVYWDVDPSEGSDQNTQEFGYVGRFNEYRTQYNRVCGDMAVSLDFWQQDRKFAGLPPLDGADFLTCVPDDALNRIFAVIDADADHLLAHWWHGVTVERCLPRLAMPSL